MPWKRLRQRRLAHALLLLLVPALLALSIIELTLTAREARRAADAAYDRSLLGALKSVESNLSFESGGLSLELPYRTFEFFELAASGPVYFRVATADGLVELGSADLPQPPAPLRTGLPTFYDGSYFGQPVRLVAYQRALEEAAGANGRTLVIQMAESTQRRQEFSQGLLQRLATRNLVFMGLAIAAVAAVVVFVLRPLAAASAAIDARAPEDLRPLDTEHLPADVRPLGAAMNQHMRRIRELVAQQREFLDDASHQLRTHLATLQVQLDYARTEARGSAVAPVLDACGAELQRAARSTNQLLSLGRSDTAALERGGFDARILVEEVAREFLPQARAAGIDLGVEGAAPAAEGDAGLLREALSNLVANAIRYGAGAPITLNCAGDAMGWSLGVHDGGPGLPAQLQAAGRQRYLRSGQNPRGGSGLGLAIAQSVAARHGGTLRLEPGAEGAGLSATLWWPRPGPVQGSPA